jgi:hypothetical protein
MKIINQTQTEKDLSDLQQSINRSLRTVIAAKDELNRAHSQTWNLPDDRLLAILQELYNRGKLEEVFTNHYIAATSLNAILTSAGYDGSLAIATAAREFEVTDGVISLVEVEVVEEIETPPIEEEITEDEQI